MSRRVLGSVLGIALAATAMLVAKQTGLLDRVMGSGPAIDCQIRDRSCILNKALVIATHNYSKREVKGNYDHHARYGAELTLLYPASQREAIRERWKEAGADEEFFQVYDRNLANSLSEQTITLDILRIALESRTSPDARNFSDFAKQGFEVVLKKQPQEGLALWKQHFLMLWKEAFGAVTTGFAWMSANNIDALEAYVADYKMPKSAQYNPYVMLSFTAADYCRKGDRISGERLLTILENDKANWKPERDMKAMDWSSMTTGILHCRGASQAFAIIEPVLAQMETDIAANQSIENQQQRNFVIGVIRSEVAERMIEPLVLDLVGKGKIKEAQTLFERMPVRVTSMALEDFAKGPTAMEFPEETFKSFINMHKDDDAYSDDPRINLRWFIENFEPDSVYSSMQEEERATKMMREIWPDPLARKAAEKLIANWEVKAKEAPAQAMDNFDKARLWIATVERAVIGCDLSDETLGRLLASVPNYKYDGSRITMLMDYVRYLDTASGPGNTHGDAGCMIR